MAVQIKVDQVAAPAGVPGQAREDLALGVGVTLTAVGGPYLSYLWRIVDLPTNAAVTVRSAAVLATPALPVTGFAPIDQQGTYFVELLVDSGSGLGATADDVARITFYAGVVIGATASSVPRRRIAYRETSEHNAPDALDAGGNPEGWAREWRRWFANIERSTTLLTPTVGQNTYVPYATAGSLAYSSALRTNGSTWVGLGPGTLATVGAVRLPAAFAIKSYVSPGNNMRVVERIATDLWIGEAPFTGAVYVETGGGGGLVVYGSATNKALLLPLALLFTSTNPVAIAVAATPVGAGQPLTISSGAPGGGGPSAGADVSIAASAAIGAAAMGNINVTPGWSGVVSGNVNCFFGEQSGSLFLRYGAGLRYLLTAGQNLTGAPNLFEITGGGDGAVALGLLHFMVRGANAGACPSVNGGSTLYLEGGAANSGLAAGHPGDVHVRGGAGALGGAFDVHGGSVYLEATAACYPAAGGVTTGGNVRVVTSFSELEGFFDVTDYAGKQRVLIDRSELSLRGTTGVTMFSIGSTGIGFYNHGLATQQTILGSRAGNAALADLLTKLALSGIIVDGTGA
jgi:hypothetical protein